MTRDRYRACVAYARASAAFLRAFEDAAWSGPLTLENARRHEAHAWARLPEGCRAAFQGPEVEQ